MKSNKVSDWLQLSKEAVDDFISRWNKAVCVLCGVEDYVENMKETEGEYICEDCYYTR